MKNFLLILLFPFVLTAQIPTYNLHVGKKTIVFDDKWQHFQGGAFLSSSCELFIYQIHSDPLIRISLGTILPMTAETCKEFLHDAKPSGMDIAVTGSGVFCGICTFEIKIDQLFKNQEQRKFYKSVKPLKT